MKLQREEVAASRTRAQYIWNDTPSLLRVLIVCATRAAEVEGRESFSRLTESARRAVHRSGAVADVLDLSWINWSQPDGCNARIRERWLAAHGIVVLAPSTWDTPPSPLKLMVECIADGESGNTESPGRPFGVIVDATTGVATPDCQHGKLGALLENLGLFAVESADAGVLASRVAVAARKLRGTGHLSAAPRVRC